MTGSKSYLLTKYVTTINCKKCKPQHVYKTTGNSKLETQIRTRVKIRYKYSNGLTPSTGKFLKFGH